MTKRLNALETRKRGLHPASLQEDSHSALRRFGKFIYHKSKVVELLPTTLQDNKIIVDAQHPLFDRYNMLGTMIMKRTEAFFLNTLMVTSTRSDAGTSTMATNLALALARQCSKSCLLVDFNFRRPRLQQLFALQGHIGLFQYLTQDIELHHALYNPSIDKFVVMPSGNQAPINPHNILGYKFEHLINDLKYRYADRYIIFDCPPINDIPETSVLSGLVDGCVLVMDHGATRKSDLDDALEAIGQENVVGYIYNHTH